MHSNITTLGYIISQQETVQGKSWTVNHVKNIEIRSQRKPEDEPRRRSNQNVQIFRKSTLNITSFGRILWAFNHDGRTKVRRINKHQAQIITTSNESTNLRHRSLICRTNRQTSGTDHRYVKRIDETKRLNH